LVSSFSTFSHRLSTNVPVQWCFLQGTSAVLRLLPSACPPGLTIVGALDMRVSLQLLPSWAHAVSLLHLSFGGVIDSAWSLFSNDPLALPTRAPPAALSRRLCHVIDKTRRVLTAQPAPPLVSTAILEAPSVIWVEGTTTCIDWNGVLPQQDPCGTLVYCPLVLSPTGWAIRSLTMLELMAVYNVSETLLSTQIRRDANTATLPFLASAPSRLLSGVLLLVTEQPRLEFQPAKPNIMPRWTHVAGLEWAGVSESTTKSDNAEAPIQVWNERALQVSHSLELHRAYIERFRRDPLDCLRTLLLAVWRR
jgi:hypothetical protein